MKVAAELDGELQAVGRVGSGLGAALIAKLMPALVASERPAPVIPCPDRGMKWVEPAFMCRVSYQELTEGVRLRHPVLVEMLEMPKGKQPTSNGRTESIDRPSRPSQ